MRFTGKNLELVCQGLEELHAETWNMIVTASDYVSPDDPILQAYVKRHGEVSRLLYAVRKRLNLKGTRA